MSKSDPPERDLARADVETPDDNLSSLQPEQSSLRGSTRWGSLLEKICIPHSDVISEIRPDVLEV